VSFTHQDIVILAGCAVLLLLAFGVPYLCDKWEWRKENWPKPNPPVEERVTQTWAQELW